MVVKRLGDPGTATNDKVYVLGDPKDGICSPTRISPTIQVFYLHHFRNNARNSDERRIQWGKLARDAVKWHPTLNLESFVPLSTFNNKLGVETSATPRPSYQQAVENSGLQENRATQPETSSQFNADAVAQRSERVDRLETPQPNGVTRMPLRSILPDNLPTKTSNKEMSLTDCLRTGDAQSPLSRRDRLMLIVGAKLQKYPVRRLQGRAFILESLQEFELNEQKQNMSAQDMETIIEKAWNTIERIARYQR